jgi:hypothetical protein
MAFDFVFKGTIYFIFEVYKPTNEKKYPETLSIFESFFYFYNSYYRLQISWNNYLARSALHFFLDSLCGVGDETYRW